MKNVQNALLKLLGNSQIDWTNFFNMKDVMGDKYVENLKEDIKGKYMWNGESSITQVEQEWLNKINQATLAAQFYNM